MAGRIDFSMHFGGGDGVNTRQIKASYRVYILGDFSLRDSRLPDQNLIRQIDRESFDQVMGKIRPTLCLDQGVELEFESLDDFHPDGWLHKVKLIADLQLLKRQLQNPVKAAQAAAKIQSFLPAASDAGLEEAPLQTAEETQEDMLQRLLGKKPEHMQDESDMVARLLKDAVSPHISKAVMPQHQNLIQIIDSTLTQLARAILHAEAFQGLEAVWRATADLLQDESAEQQQFYLVDIGRDELLAAQESADAAFATALANHVQRADEEQSIILLGDFNFSASPEDRQVLAYCDSLTESCNAYFFAAADSSLIEAVQNGVATINAEQMALVHPRYLLRLPYGQKLDPIETFAFEECSAVPQAHELLWGSSAFLAVRAFLRMKQGMSAREATFFVDVPVFSFEQDAEQMSQPGAEHVLTEAEINALLAQGILPLVGFHQRRGLRLLGMSD